VITLPAFERPEVWPVETTSWWSVGNRPCDVAIVVAVVVAAVRAVWVGYSIEWPPSWALKKRPTVATVRVSVGVDRSSI
jgi:hypothetical protein